MVPVPPSVIQARACRRSGDTKGAESHYRRALAAHGDSADLHFELAVTLMESGQAENAVLHFRSAAQLRPDSPEAWNNLGNALLFLNRLEEAIASYREAVRLRPTYAEACFNLGHALRENDDLSEGLEWYRQAVAVRPDFAKAHNNLAAALLELNEVQEAEHHFRECLRLKPGAVEPLSHLAVNGLYSANDPGIDELKSRLRDQRLSLRERELLHVAIGQLLDRADRCDEAFIHMSESNRLRRQQLEQAGEGFNSAVHRALIDNIIATFTASYFEQRRGWGLESEVPVFIVGMPRSGSSLVEQILSHHAQAAGLGESREIPRIIDSFAAQTGSPFPGCSLHLAPKESAEAAERYLARMRRAAPQAVRVADKMLVNFLNLGIIATLFPHSRVVHCVRDPLDTCTSCYWHAFRGLNFTCDLTELGQYYKEYERLMAHWREALPLPILDIVYEELVADPSTVSRRLIEFCGMPWDDRCLRFHESKRPVRTASKLQVRQPINAASIGRWRRYEKHLAPLCEARQSP